MAEIIETTYTESEIADLRASGHWPSVEELQTVEESEASEAESDEGIDLTGDGEADLDPEDIV